MNRHGLWGFRPSLKCLDAVQLRSDNFVLAENGDLVECMYFERKRSKGKESGARAATWIGEESLNQGWDTRFSVVNGG